MKLCRMLLMSGEYDDDGDDGDDGDNNDERARGANRMSEHETAGERQAEPLSAERLAADVLRHWFLSNESIDADLLQEAVRTAISALAEVDRLRAENQSMQGILRADLTAMQMQREQLAARDEIVRAVAEATVVYDGRYNYSQTSRLVWAGVKTADLWRDKASAVLRAASIEARGAAAELEPDSGGPA